MITPALAAIQYAHRIVHLAKWNMIRFLVVLQLDTHHCPSVLRNGTNFREGDKQLSKYVFNR